MILVGFPTAESHRKDWIGGSLAFDNCLSNGLTVSTDCLNNISFVYFGVLQGPFLSHILPDLLLYS